MIFAARLFTHSLPVWICVCWVSLQIRVQVASVFLAYRRVVNREGVSCQVVV